MHELIGTVLHILIVWLNNDGMNDLCYILVLRIINARQSNIYLSKFAVKRTHRHSPMSVKNYY